ncbi:zf-TFIIB domain-containing protein [Paracoccus aerodenitrificans]|uniref:TFIIB-type zinc ribbon-containing protein n=1 Tax=Paracoccus aerodenitrificans TaxID=3017781 RepID=UPI003EC07898
MKCPVDDETLLMTTRNGVEIDYCPKCRGVWLDRGELDKIIERSASEATPPVTLREPIREEQAAFGHAAEPRRDIPETTPRNEMGYRDRLDRFLADEQRRGGQDSFYDRGMHGRDHDDDDDYRDGYKRKHKKKRDSFLKDLFDF